VTVKLSSRDRWNGDGMTDPRVAHFWDQHKIIGNWFSQNVTHARGRRGTAARSTRQMHAIRRSRPASVVARKVVESSLAPRSARGCHRTAPAAEIVSVEPRCAPERTPDILLSVVSTDVTGVTHG
jgi:hypothetical protein